ncbi:MAG TPA: phospholipase [Planctomycetaceae bacterium]|nr:phospholipase [Blastopirellula sp.]HAY81668.1 phospholipase [Planctomycetaceae bacterium]
MSISPDALRELHRIHRQLTDLRGRLARGPKQIQAGEANLQRLEQEHANKKGILTSARVASDEKQLQLKQREDKISDRQAQLNTAASNKEYQAIKEQIAADEQANSVLADEILEALEKLDELEADVNTAADVVAKSKDELEKVQQKVSKEQSGLESELARVSDELSQAEAKLPADFRTEYQRIVSKRGEEALAPVDGETCGGCYTTLLPQMYNDLLMEKPVFCKSCGCLLYLPEDRNVGA